MSSVIRKRRPCIEMRQCSCGCGAWLLPGIARLEGYEGSMPVAYASLEHFVEHMRAINKGASK